MYYKFGIECTCVCTHHGSFLESSFISGEGLVSVGVPSDAAKEEVAKIHQENVERLSGFSEEEILKEKERIQQTLGMYYTCILCNAMIYSEGI